jgi:hypothetical protein
LQDSVVRLEKFLCARGEPSEGPHHVLYGSWK